MLNCYLEHLQSQFVIVWLHKRVIFTILVIRDLICICWSVLDPLQFNLWISFFKTFLNPFCDAKNLQQTTSKRFSNPKAHDGHGIARLKILLTICTYSQAPWWPCFWPINMAWRNLIQGQPRYTSTKLFENRPYTFRGEDF